jgi:hypothetical protein
MADWVICANTYAEEKRTSRKNMPGMWTALFVAQKMGKSLGGGAVLQRSMSECKT